MVHRFLTLKDFADQYGITYQRAAELGRIGILPIVRLGRQVRIDPRQLDEFIRKGGVSLPGGWRRKA